MGEDTDTSILAEKKWLFITFLSAEILNRVGLRGDHLPPLHHLGNSSFLWNIVKDIVTQCKSNWIMWELDTFNCSVYCRVAIWHCPLARLRDNMARFINTCTTIYHIGVRCVLQCLGFFHFDLKREPIALLLAQDRSKCHYTWRTVFWENGH